MEKVIYSFGPLYQVVPCREYKTARFVIKGMILRHVQSGWEQGSSNGWGKHSDSGDILKVMST